MRKSLFLLLMCIGINLLTFAQVPNFSGTAGDGHLYGYTSVKFRPGVNTLESYTTLQYGITDYFATGMDLYTGGGQVYWGPTVRGGYKVNKWFGVGLQATPSFDLTNSFKFSYATVALYMNGALIPNGNFFWCSDTWLTVNRDGSNSIDQWWYLGYSFNFGKHGGITPMVGCIHSWKFDAKPDMAAGFYYTYGVWNFYLWGNDFFMSNPRVVIGVEFNIPTKKPKTNNENIESI